MTDRKPGDEPSLFDLPLRRKPGESAERGVAPEPEPEQTSRGDRKAEARGLADRDAGEGGRGGPEASRDEPAGAEPTRDEPPFWEMDSEGPGDGGEGSASWADLEAGEPSGETAEDDPAPKERPAAVPAALTHRLAASLLDGGVLLVVTAGAILGAFLLGVRWRADDLPALGMFVLVFSFVYSVMPLAFWGRTPGMALARVLSRGADGGPLTFGQTALRWLAGLVTVALAGLPLLLALPALGGRSLADRLSGSHTWLQPDA